MSDIYASTGKKLYKLLVLEDAEMDVLMDVLKTKITGVPQYINVSQTKVFPEPDTYITLVTLTPFTLQSPSPPPPPSTAP